MKKWLVLSLILCSIFTLGLITQAQAVTWVKGDIFAALVDRVSVYDSTGTFLESYITGGSNFNTGMGFDFAGNLYVTNFGNNQIAKFTGQMTLTTPLCSLTREEILRASHVI